MAQETSGRVAIVCPGNREARRTATGDNSRFSDLFKAFAEKGIHVVIVVGVVTMIGRGGKDRREVESGYAQLLQVVEVLCDPQEVAALEPVYCWSRVPSLEVEILPVEPG